MTSELWFSVSIFQSNNPREESLNFTFICWIKNTPDRYNMFVSHFTTFPISQALPECTSKQVTGLQWMLKILVVSQTAQLIRTLKSIRWESFDGYKIIKNIGLKSINCFFLCLLSFVSSLPISSLTSLPEEQQHDTQISIKNTVVFGTPLLSLHTGGHRWKSFQDHLPEKQKGERRLQSEQATAPRIILLVLHGLAAAQPLTPVRDDLTYGSVRAGRGPDHYYTYTWFCWDRSRLSQSRKINCRSSWRLYGPYSSHTWRHTGRYISRRSTVEFTFRHHVDVRWKLYIPKLF